MPARKSSSRSKGRLVKQTSIQPYLNKEGKRTRLYYVNGDGHLCSIPSTANRSSGKKGQSKIEMKDVVAEKEKGYLYFTHNSEKGLQVRKVKSGRR